MEKVKRTERGWPGHFIASTGCLFRRNTLLEHGNKKIVVSTIGFLIIDNKIMEIGMNRYYETMAFESKIGDFKYHDADVTKPVNFMGKWAISKPDADNEANEMHDNAVNIIERYMVSGEICKEGDE